jgi:16S rRNA (cytosine1402-N4)-methyltransferase
MTNIFHKSVLTKEVLENLNPQPNKTYLDATFGGGGHTKAILEKEPLCKVIALDWDKHAIEQNAPPLIEQFGDRLKVVWGNFALLNRILETEDIKQLDGFIADFGTSQFQIKQTPGMSFQENTPLDMRMSQSHHAVKASEVLNIFTEKELADIFFKLGEEKNSRRIARAIVEYRKREKFKTTGQLTKLIESIIPRYHGMHKKYHIHPATKVFQALRIFVNKELENIDNFLHLTLKYLTPSSRLVCISFHSLEDRIVKNFFREHQNELKIITKKPITATPDELILNPSSRSAKLRAAEKK